MSNTNTVTSEGAVISPQVSKFNEIVAGIRSQSSTADIATAASIANGSDPRFVEITPTVAAVLVKDHNKRNRDVSIAKVNGYASAMERGEWMRNHQGIAFYDDNTIADGQHRLFGLTVAGAAKPDLVIELMTSPHFDAAAIRTIDVSKTRTAGDALGLLGIADAKLKATVGKSSMMILHLINEGTAMKAVTIQQVEDFVLEHDALLAKAILTGTQSTKAVGEPCISIREAAETIFLLLVGGYDEGYAVGYVAQLQQGIAPYPQAPHIYLSRIMTKAKISQRNRDKLSANEKYALLIKGAYLAMQGANVASVKWNAKKESFPSNHPPVIVAEEAA